MPGTTVGEDHVVGVERQVLIDPKLGVAAEVETRTVAVQDLATGTLAWRNSRGSQDIGLAMDL